MATELGPERAARVEPRPPIEYDWVNWFNGGVWELTRGVDFYTTHGRFQTIAHTAARRMDYDHLRTWRRGENVYLQLMDKVPVEQE